MNTGAILIVEDNELVRRTMRAVLESLGVQARVASTAEEALTMLHAGLRPLAVISDHQLDGMTGLELLSEVGALAPGTLQVLHTGYSTLEVTVRPGCALTVLSKPSPILHWRRLAAAALAKPDGR